MFTYIAKFIADLKYRQEKVLGMVRAIGILIAISGTTTLATS